MGDNIGKIMYWKYCTSRFHLQRCSTMWTPNIALYWGSSVFTNHVSWSAASFVYHTAWVVPDNVHNWHTGVILIIEVHKADNDSWICPTFFCFVGILLSIMGYKVMESQSRHCFFHRPILKDVRHICLRSLKHVSMVIMWLCYMYPANTAIIYHTPLCLTPI